MQSLANERFRSASSILSSELHKLIVTIEPRIKETATEIRLRINKPLTVCCGKKSYYITTDGTARENIIKDGMLIVNGKMITETFQRLCGFSVYSYQKELRQGYITVKGGHRAGICGTAVMNNGEVVGMREITSINIRISREITDAAAELYAKIGVNLKGTLIAGVPASGKTTVLRDFARRISLSGKNVTVIDERGELGGAFGGTLSNDLALCDVLNGYPKAYGIMQALRAMSPDVIICDEIGSLEDCYAVRMAINTGVIIIASIHADSLNGLINQARGKQLIDTGAFEHIVVLKGKKQPGEIEGIYRAKVNTDAENNRNYINNSNRNGNWNNVLSKT